MRVGRQGDEGVFLYEKMSEGVKGGKFSRVCQVG